MRLILAAAALGMVLGAMPVWADDKPSAAEEAKIKATVESWGCQGGQFEKESESTGVFEANDVTCRGSNFDFKLDKEFTTVSITAD
jgi:hypothetical protein